MCHECDAPDVLAEALDRSNELGLLLSHNRIHDVLMAWGAMLDLHKIEQVSTYCSRINREWKGMLELARIVTPRLSIV